MPAPFRRTKSQKKKKVKTPGAKLSTYYSKRKQKGNKCSKCQKILSGVPKDRKTDLKRLSKSKKRPMRPYAGTLCAACLKIAIEESIFNSVELKGIK